MAKRAKSIVITPTEQKLLRNICWDNEGIFDLTSLVEELKLLRDKGPKGQLHRWLREHKSDLCNHGQMKLLQEAKKGKIHSWPDYFRKHWNNNDGILGWLDGSGVARRVFFPNPTHYSSYDEFKADVQGSMKWLPWPFKKPRKNRRR